VQTFTFLDTLQGIGLAAVMGGLIGLERELHGQAAGLRTHMVVSIGAALMMIISIDIATGGGRHGDPGRVAAQVVSGVGFLGAGAIMRFGTTVKGLTTAACLWTAAGVGLACGAQYLREAGLATAFVLLSTFIFERIEHAFIHGANLMTFRILAKDEAGLLGRAEAVLTSHGVQIKNVGVNKEIAGNTVRLTVLGKAPKTIDVDALVREISALPGLSRIDVE
jgi:putative Mg2+ transporter-C (MgtC) family protein